MFDTTSKAKQTSFKVFWKINHFKAILWNGAFKINLYIILVKVFFEVLSDNSDNFIKPYNVVFAS